MEDKIMDFVEQCWNINPGVPVQISAIRAQFPNANLEELNAACLNILDNGLMTGYANSYQSMRTIGALQPHQ
jgi:hypothetical protein